MAALLLVVLTLGAVTDANAQSPPTISDVVIFATNRVHLKKDTEVTGDVVVNELGFDLSVDKDGVVHGNLKADRISIAKGAEINGDVFFNDLNNKGTINGGENSPLALPVFGSLPPFQTANPRPNAPDVIVNAGETKVLDAGDFGNITVAQTGTLIFSGGRYDVRSLTSGKTSTIGFGAATGLRILERLDIDQNSLVGPEASSSIAAFDIIIYDGSHRSDDIFKAFVNYFQILKPGGIYVVEDTHTMYWDDYQGGILKQTTAHSFFKLFVDVINYQ
ncbi:MAG: hypothetical protein IH820_09485, partial [Bacteroidetes bacterium]|nr:hypothetical protein [Bacteroidota bacterium]